MRSKVFVVQPIPEVALDVLRQAADVCVYPYMDRQISVDELVGGAKRSDWLLVLHETHVTAEVINANPDLQGIGSTAATPHIDVAAANARKLPIVLGDSTITGSQATADLTMAMLLGLAYRLVEADRYTRCGKFRQEQTMALMGIGCPGKTVGLMGRIPWCRKSFASSTTSSSRPQRRRDLGHSRPQGGLRRAQHGGDDAGECPTAVLNPEIYASA